MRRALAIQLCLALVPALLESSFLHTHGNHRSKHFREAHGAKGLAAHVHLQPAPQQADRAPGAQLRSEDNEPEAEPLSWFQAREAPAQPLVFEVAEFPGAQALELEAHIKPVPSPRGHDPPALRSSPARAPPA
jgi:hypothetical protein